MPHGNLTPLGRQLRSVLATFRPTLLHRHQHQHPTAAYHAPSPRCAASASSATAAIEDYNVNHPTNIPSEQDEVEGEIAGPVRRITPGKPSRRILNSRSRPDRLTEVLKERGRTDVIPRTDTRQSTFHVNLKSSTGWQQYEINAERHRQDPIPVLEQSHELTLARILASYMQYQDRIKDSPQADWLAPFSLTPDEKSLLETRGYTLDDLESWAHFLQLSDPLDLAHALDERVSAKGIESVPFFVMAYVLRRQYISARALRILMKITWKLLEHRMSGHPTSRLNEDSIFQMFVRLHRHMRVVWPLAMDSLASMLLHFLPLTQPNSEHVSPARLGTWTYQLNKAMYLLATRTSIEPFKNSILQEAAIVRILRFMAEHNPPLDLNKEGYRAVMFVQLAQGKTASDRQWAGLKALSWPPWKEDRTAMDADFTPEKHGLTRAGDTLRRMHEAGHQSSQLENAASIYTGWDTDGTPTVQERVLLGPRRKFQSRNATWVARIKTARTAQEAWAAYLAFEDQRLPPDQDVFLAVFHKLNKEGERLAGKDSRTRSDQSSRDKRLLPGDTQELEPPPPSIHLHTYTRTPPPTVDEFYDQLMQKGVVFEGRCLAFLVARASSLRRGLEYIHASTSKHPAIQGLFQDDGDLSELPMHLFVAFVELLGRFSNSRLPKTPRPHSDIIFRTTSDHALPYAIKLLRRRRPLYRPSYNAVLRALGKKGSVMCLVPISTVPLRGDTSQPLTQTQNEWVGAFTAWQLVQEVTTIMKQLHLDLDADGFKALCHSAENEKMTSLQMMYEDAQQPDSSIAPTYLTPKDYAQQGVLPHAIEGYLLAEFNALIGEDQSSKSEEELPAGLEQPRLLDVPSFAILHQYVRALGWRGRYKLLLKTVTWMVRHHVELDARRQRDRNGEALMRRTLTAVRVFLERSWIEDDQTRTDVQTRGSWARRLKMHETPARASVVDEVKNLVESVEDWGGWPSDEEVEAYCSDVKFRQFSS